MACTASNVGNYPQWSALSILIAQIATVR